MPTVKEVVAMAMAEAAKEDFGVEPVVEKPAVSEAPKENLETYINRKIKDNPGDVILVSEEFGEATIVPGFETFSIGLAQVYGLKWGALGLYLEWKLKAYHPHIVPTSIGTVIIRGFSRREWSSLQKKILEHTRDRITKHTEESSDQRWAETEIQMHTEEMIVVAGSCDPKFTMETIREVPTGIVSHLANCIMIASGHETNPLPPMPLK